MGKLANVNHWLTPLSRGVSWSLKGPGGSGAGGEGSAFPLHRHTLDISSPLYVLPPSLCGNLAHGASRRDASSSVTLFAHKWRWLKMTVCQLGCSGVQQSLESYAEQFSAPFPSTCPPLRVQYMQWNDSKVFLNPFHFAANITRTHKWSKLLCLMCLHQLAARYPG